MSEQKLDKQKQEEPDTRFDNIANGPVSTANRSCTDLFCCLLITANIAAMVALAIYAYSEGNTNNIYRATDQNLNICGQTGTKTEAYPYAYFYNPTTHDLSKRVCTKNCPEFDSSGTLTPLDCYHSADFPSGCPYTVTVTQNGSFSSAPSSSSFIGYESTDQIKRVCVPKLIVLQNALAPYADSMSEGFRQAGLANFITDLQNNWRWLILSMVLAIVLSFIFMFFLRCFAGCFVWVSILALIIITAAVGLLFLYNGGVISKDRVSYIGNLGVEVPTLPSFQYYDIFGYICLGISGLIILITLCCCSRLKLAVAVCGVAGKFVASVCQIIFVPIVSGILLFGFWVACVIAMIGLIGRANFVVKGGDVFTSIQNYTDNKLVMFYYFVFGTLWVNALIQAIAIFVVASACAVWYYNHNAEASISSPVCTGFWQSIRYHLGSLAFGSLILAIVQFIQFIVELFKKQAQSVGQNKCVEYLFNCLRCCLVCLERIIEFLNRNAYIQIAITGKNFCSASSDAFSLIASNPVRYAIVGGVGQIIMFLGKIVIAGLTTFLFYLLITFVNDIRANVQEPIYLLVIVFIASYAIAVVFMAVYSIAMETIMACFIIDERTHKKPVHAPEELLQLMNTD